MIGIHHTLQQFQLLDRYYIIIIIVIEKFDNIPLVISHHYPSNAFMMSFYTIRNNRFVATVLTSEVN